MGDLRGKFVKVGATGLSTTCTGAGSWKSQLQYCCQRRLMIFHGCILLWETHCDHPRLFRSKPSGLGLLKSIMEGGLAHQATLLFSLQCWNLKCSLIMLLLNITLFTFNINTTITIIHNCHKKMVAIILLLRPLLQLHLLYPQYKPLGSELLAHLCSLEQVQHGRQPFQCVNQTKVLRLPGEKN